MSYRQFLETHFTEPAQKIIQGAEELARSRDDYFLGPEHLLISLMEGDERAAVILARRGLTAVSVLPLLPDEKDKTPDSTAQAIPELVLTPGMRQLLDYAFRYACHANPMLARSDHLLLAVTDATQSQAGKIMKKMKVDINELRREVKKIVTSNDIGNSS